MKKAVVSTSSVGSEVVGFFQTLFTIVGRMIGAVLFTGGGILVSGGAKTLSGSNLLFWFGALSMVGGTLLLSFSARRGGLW